MRTSSRFLQRSADLVRRFSDLGEAKRLYTEAKWFEEALATAVAGAGTR